MNICEHLKNAKGTLGLIAYLGTKQKLNCQINASDHLGRNADRSNINTSTLL